MLNDQKDNVSLILLDIVMPVMDGYTFLSILKNDPSISSIPVIVATQNDNESDEVAALSHGATDFVAKPLSLIHIYSKFSEQESSLRYPSASQNRVKVWRHCRKRSAPGRSSDEKSSLKRESALTNEGVGTVVSGN